MIDKKSLKFYILFTAILFSFFSVYASSSYKHSISSNNAINDRFQVMKHIKALFDRKTSLLWQQEPSMKKMIWEEAMEYASGLRTAGYSDWRLPSIQEIKTLLEGHLNENVKNGAEPPWKYLNKIGFKNIPAYRFWSSTKYGRSYALGVNMSDGVVNDFFQGSQYYVLVVRFNS
jgi:hypothetical protein